MILKLIDHLKSSTWFEPHHIIFREIQINQITSFLALSKPTCNYCFIVADVDEKPDPLKYRGRWIQILKSIGKFMENTSLLKEDWAKL